jgi:putative ABC transport system permease protein
MVLSLLSLVIAFIWIFTLSIGCLLLLAIVLANINLRIYQNNLMRIFGAAKSQLLGALIIEYVIIGAIAGAIGSLSAIIIAQQVSMHYLTLAYSFNWLLIIYGVLTGIAIMLIGGYFGTRKIFANSPIQINRNLS